MAGRLLGTSRLMSAIRTLPSIENVLTDCTERFPMPVGGLFSTATDLARFYQLLANGGVFEGQRLLSQEAIAEITSKQTREAGATEYGSGFSTGGYPLRAWAVPTPAGPL